jgi:hypothetical protein
MASKYLTITDVTEPNSKKKTKNFIVTNKKSGDHLGWINWYPPFRKYAFTSACDIVYDPNCLNDISSFLTNLMKEHKKQKS